MFVTGTHFHLGSGVQLAAQFLRWHLYYFWRTEEAGRPFFSSTEPAQSTQAIGSILLSQIPWPEIYVYSYYCYELVFQDFSPIRTTWRLTYLRCLHDAFNILCTQNIDVWQSGSQHDFLTVWKQRQNLTTTRFEGKENFICALFISTFWHFMWRSWLLADYSQGLVLLFHPKLQEIHKERICHYMPMSHLEWNEWIWF